MGSMYHLQLQQWERTWPRQQVLVVQFEMLVGDRFADVYRQMIAFFGLATARAPAKAWTTLPHSNLRESPCKIRSINCHTRGMLQTLYTPWNGLFNRALAAAHKAGKAPPEELLFEIGASVVACSDEVALRPQVNLSRCTL